MSLVTSLPFPSGRTLAGWGKQLASLEPLSWWVGHVLVHRVEAAVSADESLPLSPENHFILQTLDRHSRAASLAELEKEIHLPAPLLGQILRRHIATGWVETAASHYRLTASGQTALAEGRGRSVVCRREVFSFLERRDAAGARAAAPVFIPLDAAHVGKPSAETLPFDKDWLSACVSQERDWKEAHGFPVQVLSLLDAASKNGDELEWPAWKKVIVDRLEELSLVLVQGQKDPQRFLGFTFRVSDWRLDLAQPVLSGPWQASFEAAPSAEACREAWLAWARPRNLPQADMEACEVTLSGSALRLRASHRLVDLLRQGKSDILKGEAWVLLGSGDIRRAARLELL
jgi:hypothetical protein